MKHTVIAVTVFAMLGLTACGSTKKADVGNGGAVPAGTQQAIAEQRLSSDYKRNGIRVVYTMSGKLEAIEATGYASVWGNSQNAEREAFRVAELEAKKSLNDFINKETVRSTTSVSMISRNLEKARDNRTNNFSTNRRSDDITTVDDEVVAGSESADVNRKENTAVRQDALTIASRVNTSIVTQNRGILGGLYLVEGEVINDGRTVRVVYRWDTKHNAVRNTIRSAMAQ